MPRPRYTGLAGTAVALAEKVRATDDGVSTMLRTLSGAGQDYEDCCDQCEKIRSAVAVLADYCLDLAALILKADKASAINAEEEKAEQAKGSDQGDGLKMEGKASKANADKPTWHGKKADK